jgi:5-formyltetrahydrofolate cyclo-ligase
MAVPPPSPDKPALRAQLRAARASFVASMSDDARALAEIDAARRVVEHIAHATTVALYHPLADELGTIALAIRLAHDGKLLSLPRVEADRTTMRFHRWALDEPLARGGFGLMEPGGAEIAPQVIVTPLVGFDRAGNRIGQGAGHYDRAFAALPGAMRIGYAWSMQEVAHVPHDPWDVPLHAIATEKEWIAVQAEP